MKLPKMFAKSKTNIKRAKIIKLLGLSRGVGTTHLSIMLGLNLVKGRHLKVALVEYGQHGCYEQIKRYKKTKQVRLSFKAAAERAFSCSGIDFYQKVINDGVLGILVDEYDYIIYDMKLESNEYTSAKILGEWMNSDVCIVVTSNEIWKLRECQGKLTRIVNLSQGRTIKVVSLSDRKDKKSQKRNMDKINIDIIPWEPDPFCLSAVNLPWLNSLAD